MRITTYNVNSLTVRLDHVARFAALHKPDVLALQETKLPDERFPVAQLQAMGFPHIAFTGQKSYNGVALLSKHPLMDVQTEFLDGAPHPDRRLIAATVKGIRIYGLYCPNGTEVGSERYVGKLAWFRRLRAELDQHFTPADPIVLTGDFNVTPTESDTWDPFLTDGQLINTDAERAVFDELLAFGFSDAWREKNPYFVDFTHWDYQGMGYQRNRGMRIDHFLLTADLMKRCTQVTIHRDVREWDRPSDHAPVSADLS